MSNIPWWTWTAPLWPTLIMMIFVLTAGWLQGRKTGHYPTLRESVQALRALNPFPAVERIPPGSDRPATDSQQQTDHPVPENSSTSPHEHSADSQADLTSR
ncbi:hypothetical protein EV385_6244 [Krasilnikovia cinnamomea]|uniref:Uncharacterized protein n=1 Tax=Krasilnikovia cinnamomea TaxID=349313 RepID=A0A4Q7ZUN3_9ACTN|nr:hypothetical protein EV385_6244 [Krasilnikovia cinnamomea]